MDFLEIAHSGKVSVLSKRQTGRTREAGRLLTSLSFSAFCLQQPALSRHRGYRRFCAAGGSSHAGPGDEPVYRQRAGVCRYHRSVL